MTSVQNHDPGPRKLSRDKRDSEEPLLLSSITLSSCGLRAPTGCSPTSPQATASTTPTPHSRYECPWQQHGISGSLYSERRPTSPDDRSWHAKIIGTSAMRFLGGAPRRSSRLRRCPSSFCRGYTKAALPFCLPYLASTPTLKLRAPPSAQRRPQSTSSNQIFQ